MFFFNIILLYTYPRFMRSIYDFFFYAIENCINGVCQYKRNT